MDFEATRLRKMYNNLPVNMRTFIETVAGADRTITEQDFTPEDLAYMRKLVEQTRLRNEQTEQTLKDRRDTISEMGLYELGKNNELVDITEKELANLDRKIKSYADTRNRTSVQYRDIAKTQTPSTDEGAESIVQTVKDSFSDPAYRVKTTLGRFTAEHQDDGSIVIKDTYDWNKLEEKPTFKEFMAAVPEMANNPRMAGNAFMRLMKPDTAREVRIQLPPKKGMLTTGK